MFSENTDVYVTMQKFLIILHIIYFAGDVNQLERVHWKLMIHLCRYKSNLYYFIFMYKRLTAFYNV